MDPGLHALVSHPTTAAKVLMALGATPSPVGARCRGLAGLSQRERRGSDPLSLWALWERVVRLADSEPFESTARRGEGVPPAHP